MFEFKGNWTFDLELEEFRIFTNPEYKSRNQVSASGMVSFEIFDEFNDNPDPERYQINAIEYLLDPQNQGHILHNILTYSQNIIYPQYQTFMHEDEYPQCYPPLISKEDLDKLFGINQIIIKHIGHQNYAYYILDCSSCLDHEHGITLTLHKDQVIDHGEDWDDIKVCEHKGIDYKIYRKKAVNEFNSREIALVEPHPKYNKLKPWQKEQNEFYPFGLYHKGRLQEFISELDKGVFPKESTISRVLELSILHEKEEFTQYLIELNVKNKYAAFKKALEKDRYDILDKLLKQGYDLNAHTGEYSHFYQSINSIITAIQNNEEVDIYTKRLDYLIEKGIDPYLKGKWGRNISSRMKQIRDIRLRLKVEKVVLGSILTRKLLVLRIKNYVKSKREWLQELEKPLD